MYTVIQTGGKQYTVAKGEEIKVEKIMGNVGETITFDQVLLTSNGDKIDIGKPFLDGTKVIGRITYQGKNRKIVVFKYKRRKKYRKKQGHRQRFTLVRIENIET